MSRAARWGLLLAVAGTLAPLEALAQTLPSYAHPSYASVQFVVRGQIVALGNSPDVEVSDGAGHVSDIGIAPGMTIMPDGLQLGMPVVIYGVRGVSGNTATKIEIADAPPEAAPAAAPDSLMPIAPPDLTPPAAAAPVPPASKPQKAPRLAGTKPGRTPHAAVIARLKRPRQYRQAPHAKAPANARVATVRRIPRARAATPSPVRRDSRSPVDPSPQEIAPTWYGWGKL